MDYEITYTNKQPYKEVLASIKPTQPFEAASYGEGTEAWRNQLYQGDNLGYLKYLIGEGGLKGKIKLIYIDPPYATQQSFRTKRDEHAYHDTLAGASYIDFIRARLILLRELLAEDGSIYLHLDEKMAFPLKVIMDEIFGAKNYRNWITRQKCSFKNYTSRQYGNISDYILYYSKGKNPVWNRPTEETGMVYNFEQRFPRIEKETGRRYALVPIHARGERNGETGKPWRGLTPPPGKHWQMIPSKLDELDKKGEIYWSPNGNPRRKIYADQDKGVYVQDIWLNLKDERNQMVEVTGYPTEKNAELLKRIINTSSNPGDIVLDCFSGSGTTLAVADELGRRWIGMDESEVAISTTIKRLRKNKPQPLPLHSDGTVAYKWVLFERKSLDKKLSQPVRGKLSVQHL